MNSKGAIGKMKHTYSALNFIKLNFFKQISDEVYNYINNQI